MGVDDSDDTCSCPNTGTGEEVDEVNKERDSGVEGNVETTGKDVEEGCTGADVDVEEGCTDVEVEGDDDADTSGNKVEEGCTVEVTDVIIETGGSDINTRGVDSCWSEEEKGTWVGKVRSYIIGCYCWVTWNGWPKSITRL